MDIIFSIAAGIGTLVIILGSFILTFDLFEILINQCIRKFFIFKSFYENSIDYLKNKKRYKKINYLLNTKFNHSSEILNEIRKWDDDWDNYELHKKSTKPESYKDLEKRLESEYFIIKKEFINEQ